jgi:hypothetical protein
MWKKIVIVAVAIMLLSSAIPLHQRVGHASPTTTVVVQSAYGILPGSTFSVNVTVSNVIDCYSWQFYLYFDSSVLSFTNIEEGDFLGTPGSHFFFNNTFTGYISVYASLSGNVPGVSGSGTLATVIFRAVGSGSSTLHLNNTSLYDSRFPIGQIIPSTSIDGHAYVGGVDVAVGEIDTPPSIPQGSMALINVTAQNRGQVAESFDVTLSYDSSPIDGTKSIINMPGGGSQVLSFAWDTTSIPIGPYTLTATATTVPGEIDTSDNTLSVNVFVGTIDIAITGVSMKTSIPSGYNGTEVDVTVQNSGQATETLNVTLSANSHSVDNQTTTLHPGASGTVALWWNTTTLGYGNYTVQAFIPPLPFQIDTTNDNFTTTAAVTIPGDLNGDFIVGLSDLVILARSYGSTSGAPNWNPNADITGTGKVSLVDLVVLAVHYGQHFP